MGTGSFDILRGIANFEGYAELAVLEACERGVNTVYWVMMWFALPPALLLHLWLNYTVYGWVYIVVPLAYLPVALGWFPRNQIARFYLATIAMTLLALSINALYDWGAQPGLYILIPPAMIIFIVQGAKPLIFVTLAQMVVVGLTASTLGISSGETSPWGVITALALWVAIVLACAIIVHQILLSSRFRAIELESLSDKLMANEAMLRENNRSLRHIFGVSLEQISSATDDLEAADNPGAKEAASRRLHGHIEDLRERVLPEESDR